MNRPARPAARVLLPALCGMAALAILSIATPARAADADVQGWFAALDLASTQPNSLDEQYAVTIDPDTGFAERQNLENETHFSWRGSVGYTFGRGLGSLQVSYWTFDNDQSLTKTFGDAVYPSLFGFGPSLMTYIYFNDPPTDVTATSSVKARTIDVDYVRPLVVGDVLTVNWITGLRSATFEEDRGFEAIHNTDINATVCPCLIVQNRHIKTTAAGIRFGVGTVFGFSKHFSLEGSLAVSFLQAKVDALAAQELVGSSVTVTDSLEGSSSRVRGEIRDYDARAVWTYGRLKYYLGYGGSTWDGLVADPISGFEDVIPFAQRSRDSVAFNSVHAGIVFRFGSR